MLESLIQIGLCLLFAIAAVRSVATGKAHLWFKPYQRSQRPLYFWALVALFTLLAVGNGYYGIEGLL